MTMTYEEIGARFDALNAEVTATRERFAALEEENEAYKKALADCRRELEAVRKTIADTAQENADHAAKAEKAAQALSGLTDALERETTKQRQWQAGYRRLESIRASAPDGTLKGLVDDVQLVLSGDPDAVAIGESSLRTRLKGNPGVILDESETEKGGLCYLHDEDVTRRNYGSQNITGFARR